MSAQQKLRLIKLLHTIIWLFFNVLIAYLLYAVITNQVGTGVWVAIGIILAEGLVLLLFNNTCPLTVWARKYSQSTKHNFDIYLPEWLAQHNKVIYTGLFLVALMGLLWRLLG